MDHTLNEPEIIQELLNPEASKEEVHYIHEAIRNKMQSTEILYVLMNTRLANFTLRNLSGAMENSEFIVYPLYPIETQKLFSILKEMIIRVHKLSITRNGEQNV